MGRRRQRRHKPDPGDRGCTSPWVRSTALPKHRKQVQGRGPHHANGRF